MALGVQSIQVGGFQKSFMHFPRENFRVPYLDDIAE
jgi:hypothetical protein